MDIKGNMLPSKSTCDIPRKSYRKMNNTGRWTRDKKELELVKGKKTHVLARP
jgi:hypothetical protein